MDIEKYCKKDFVKHYSVMSISNFILFISSLIISILSIINLIFYLWEMDELYIDMYISPPIILILSIPLMVFSIYNIIILSKIKKDVCPNIKIEDYNHLFAID